MSVFLKKKNIIDQQQLKLPVVAITYKYDDEETVAVITSDLSSLLDDDNDTNDSSRPVPSLTVKRRSLLKRGERLLCKESLAYSDINYFDSYEGMNDTLMESRYNTIFHKYFLLKYMSNYMFIDIDCLSCKMKKCNLNIRSSLLKQYEVMCKNINVLMNDHDKHREFLERYSPIRFDYLLRCDENDPDKCTFSSNVIWITVPSDKKHHGIHIFGKNEICIYLLRYIYAIPPFFIDYNNCNFATNVKEYNNSYDELNIATSNIAKNDRLNKFIGRNYRNFLRNINYSCKIVNVLHDKGQCSKWCQQRHINYFNFMKEFENIVVASLTASSYINGVYTRINDGFLVCLNFIKTEHSVLAEFLLMHYLDNFAKLIK